MGGEESEGWRLHAGLLVKVWEWLEALLWRGETVGVNA